MQAVFNPDLPDEWSVPATVEMCEPAGDVAVLVIDSPESHRGVQPATFGRVGMRPAVLACRAVGFPRFKLRPGQAASNAAAQPYRDVHQADGTISSLSNWREGTLEITVPVPPDPDPGHSPWEGMSGAAVWCEGRIVGIVSRHHRSEGLGRLAAVRTDRWYQQLTASSLARFRELAGLPADADQLADVISPKLAHSGYLEQVRQIAPAELHDRDGELAELAAFCRDPGSAAYMWWRAAAWTGKSALMSWFVLNPPPDVQIVAFFITARYKGQDDRVGFTDVLLEQLAELLERPTPAFWAESTRESHLLAMLAEGAAACQNRGQRLVLVVDGLDEDRGVTTGPDSRSIAALLPSRPQAGLRIIAAGRRDPPIPADVPGDHPLRDSAIVRELTGSRWAEIVRADMQRELKRLLHGSPVEQDLLGLVAAAGGGLSSSDLAQLTGLSDYDVEETLHAVSGRTFTARASRYQPGTAPPVYVLGHEELQVSAVQALGESRLAGYRTRLLDWAQGYRRQGWPGWTPEYLLRGYYRMLRETADVAGVAACATDQARHEWMLDVTGSDAAAHAEVRQAQELVFTPGEFSLHTGDRSCNPGTPAVHGRAGSRQRIDLVALALLAIELDRLSSRSDAIPVELPAVWARLGYWQRARELARSIPDPDRRAQAFDAIENPPAESGFLQAERVFRNEVSRHFGLPLGDEAFRHFGLPLGDWDPALTRSRFLLEFPRAEWESADAQAKKRMVGQAVERARAVTWSSQRAADLAGIAETIADTNLDQAVEIAAEAVLSIDDPKDQALALACIAETLATVDPHEAFRKLGDAVIAMAKPGRSQRTISYSHRARILTKITDVLAALGPARVRQLAQDAEAAAERLDASRAITLAAIAEVLAWADPARAADLRDKAEIVARSIEDEYARGRALDVIAEKLAATYPDWALRVAAGAPEAGSVYSAWRAIQIELPRVVAALAVRGIWDQATQAARAIADPKIRRHSLTELAAGLVAAEPEQAARVAAEAEQAVRLTDLSPPGRARLKAAMLIQGLAAAGKWGRAERAAGTIPNSASFFFRSPSELTIVEGLSAAGRPDRAEQAARAIVDRMYRARALAVTANALANAWPDRARLLSEEAEELAHGCHDQLEVGNALGGIAYALVRSDRERALRLAEEAERLLADPAEMISNWGSAADLIAGTFAAAGLWDRAVRVGLPVLEPGNRTGLLAVVASEMAAAGLRERGANLARAIEFGPDRPRALAMVAGAIYHSDGPEAARLADEAEELADNLTDPHERACALTWIVSGLSGPARSGSTRQGREMRARLHRLLAKALVTEGWFHALPELGKVSAEAILAVYRRTVATGRPDTAQN